MVGDEFWLITQPDHARLAAELLGHFGNGAFSNAYVNDDLRGATALHDDGWAAHDAAPTVNSIGSPLDVFEPSPDVVLPLWRASASAAQEHSAAAGLLVSCHVLTLSAYLASREQTTHISADPAVMLTRFALNKFQHYEFERQETLRRILGLRTDWPTTLGLAENCPDPAEQLLTARFRLLQAMDLLSLALCCTKPPGDRTGPLHSTPAAPATSIQFHLQSQRTIALGPWPFAEKRLELSVPYRAVPARRYADDADLRAVYDAAPQRPLRVSVVSA